MEPPKVLLTDVGNVLVSFRAGTTKRIFAEIFRCDEEEAYRVTYQTEEFRRLERGECAWEEYRAYLIGELGRAGRAAEILTPAHRSWLEDNLDRYWLASLGEQVDAVVVLWRLMKRHLTIASASNVDARRYSAGVARFKEIVELFDHDTHSFLLGRRKGDPDYFDRLLAQVGAAPEECLFVDDLVDHVADAGRKGIRAIWFADTTPDDVAQLRRDLALNGVPEEWLVPEQGTVGA